MPLIDGGGFNRGASMKRKLLQNPNAMDVCDIPFGELAITRYHNKPDAQRAARSILGPGAKPTLVTNRFQSVWVVAQMMADKTWRFYGRPETRAFWIAQFDYDNWRVTGVYPEMHIRCQD